jgi:hypothetical protein
MEEIDKCYEILKVNKSDSFRKIKKSYNSLMLKYHPSRPLGRLNRVYFRDIVLAFDLLAKLNRYSTDFSKSNKELYQEWVDLDKSFALEQVELYAKMRYKDFEREFLPGCFTVIKGLVYFVIFILSIIAIYVPIYFYKEGQFPGVGLFIISAGYTIPLFIVIYKTIVDEKFITRRTFTKIKMIFFKLRLRIHNKIPRSQIEEERNLHQRTYLK